MRRRMNLDVACLFKVRRVSTSDLVSEQSAVTPHLSFGIDVVYIEGN